MICLTERSRACRNRRLLASWFLSLAMVSVCFAADLPAPRDEVGIAARAGAVDNAFTPAAPPKVTITLSNPGNAQFNGLVRVECFDLLTETTTTDFVDCRVPTLNKADVLYQPKLSYGVHRLTLRAATGKEPAQAASASAQLTVAYSPAKLAKDLPDDWPLGTHHYNPSPVLHGPMPGFKWYRTFSSWADLNPKKGEYDWKSLDATLSDVKQVGGKLLVASEGAPLWASAKARAEKARESRYAPDDWNDYRTFLRELVRRYDDGSGALGVVEVWNEYNANLRWKDSFENLVEIHKVTFEETRKTQGRIRVAGITISPGHHVDYVEGLTERGVLKYCDIVAGHFYEEPGSPCRLNPRNSFPLHVDLLRIPMLREKRFLPIWNTEWGMGYEGVNGGPRPGGRMKTQNELVKELHARPNFNPNEPWLSWPPASERRMAARVVTCVVSGLAQGIEKHFTFHPNWYCFDKALNLPWVANGCLGSVLEQVDFHYVMPLGINAVGGPKNIGAVAYRLGKPGGKQVVVLWAVRVSTKHPHADGWSEWVDPVPIQLPCAEGIEVTVHDLYLRTGKKIKAARYPGGDAVTIEAGEEPVFVWDWKFRDQ